MAAAVVAFMGPRRDEYVGHRDRPPEALTAELPTTGESVPLRPHGWPKRANELGNILRRLAPDLRRVHHLDVNCDGRTHRGRMIRITCLADDAGKTSSRSSRSSPPKESLADDRDDAPGEGTGALSRRRHGEQVETPRKTTTRDDRDDRDDDSRPLSGPPPSEPESENVEEMLKKGIRECTERNRQRDMEEHRTRMAAAATSSRNGNTPPRGRGWGMTTFRTKNQSLQRQAVEILERRAADDAAAALLPAGVGR